MFNGTLYHNVLSECCCIRETSITFETPLDVAFIEDLSTVLLYLNLENSVSVCCSKQQERWRAHLATCL